MSSIDAVLKDIHRLTKRFCYVVVDLQPAVKKLADGRNAHILLAPYEWWVARFAQLFKCQASFHNAFIRDTSKLLLLLQITSHSSPIVWFPDQNEAQRFRYGGRSLRQWSESQKQNKVNNMSLQNELDFVRSRWGPWTAHNIQLDRNLYTISKDEAISFERADLYLQLIKIYAPTIVSSYVFRSWLSRRWYFD